VKPILATILVLIRTTQDLEVVLDLEADRVQVVAAVPEVLVLALRELALPLALALVVLDLEADLAAVLEADQDLDPVRDLEVDLVLAADLAAVLEVDLAVVLDRALEVDPAVDLEAVRVLVAPAAVLVLVALALVLAVLVPEAALEVVRGPEAVLAPLDREVALTPTVDLIPVKRAWRKRFVRYLLNVE
jgi:hypothetical protein